MDNNQVFTTPSLPQMPSMPQMPTMPSIGQSAPNNHPGNSFPIKKILLIIVGLVILGEAAWGIYTLSKNLKGAQLASNSDTSRLSPEAALQAAQGSAKLSLGGPSQVTAGDTFSVTVYLANVSKTDGVDVVLNYDPKVLDVVPQVPGSTTAFKTSSVYPETPVNIFDSQAGKISLSSVIGSSGQGIVAEGELGTLTFKAKTSGQTKLTFDYTKGSTTGSNVIESKTGHDILKEVTNLTINVK